MKTEKKFLPNKVRYDFDFGECSMGKGFAQVDTSQDASYYGTWANPFTLTVINFAEGDVCTRIADTEEEFIEELLLIKRWNDNTGNKFKGIDTGFDKELREKFVEIGAEELLY